MVANETILEEVLQEINRRQKYEDKKLYSRIQEMKTEKNKKKPKKGIVQKIVIIAYIISGINFLYFLAGDQPALKEGFLFFCIASGILLLTSKRVPAIIKIPFGGLILIVAVCFAFCIKIMEIFLTKVILRGIALIPFFILFTRPVSKALIWVSSLGRKILGFIPKHTFPNVHKKLWWFFERS